jgi:cardiolipin synthase
MGWKAVEFLEGGDDYYLTLLDEFRKAEFSILMESYIFRLDRVGEEILKALAEAKQRQVHVFLRIDGVGSWTHLREICDFCAKEEIDLEVFHPLPFTRRGKLFSSRFAPVDSLLRRFRLMNRRSHRKLVIIDNKVAFAGGRNVDEVQSETFFGDMAWHDLTLRLEGEPVKNLIKAFWFKPVPRAFPNRSLLMNHTWRLRQSRINWFARRMHRSESRIWAITPYFAPTPLMLFQLRAAARRGVDVRVILSRKSDVMISRLAAIGLYRRLLPVGIHVFEYRPALLHRKLWVIDDLAVVGSANYNHRSFIHEKELDLVLREPHQLSQAEALFQADQQNSVEIKKEELAQQPVVIRMVSWIASWFSYWL